ncbi:MAG: glycosyltransferase family 2 protein [Nitrospinae bacterium]|nr:glycosyltransferase family 2 protein [Nitrospinota bacterium]
MINPKISVIIPVYNGEESLRSCLKSVFNNSFKPFEVIVVDDASTDDSAKIAAEFDCSVFHLKKNSGCAVARNLGANHARGEIFFFTDADVILKEDTLASIQLSLVERETYSAVFGSYQKTTPVKNFISQYKNLLHHFTHQNAHCEASTLWTGCMAIYRKTFFELNGFEEEFDCGSIEDIDLGYRMKEKGYQIYLDKSIQVTHLKKLTFFSLVKTDLFNRAIPWTKIMLRNNVMSSDLNIKSSNKFGVLITFLLLLAIFFQSISTTIPLILSFFVIVYLLNIKFFHFIYKEKSFIFVIKALCMVSLFYLYSGFGMIMGTCCFFLKKLKFPLKEIRELLPQVVSKKNIS